MDDIVAKFKAAVVDTPAFEQFISQPVIVAAVIAVLVVLVNIEGLLLLTKTTPKQVERCNRKIQLNEAKVVDTVKCADIEDIGKDGKPGKCVMCRCWKSEKFPYCDGSHAKHNAETGDNVGPLIITKAT
jgi:CDGSH-type Zn-finger protein